METLAFMIGVGIVLAVLAYTSFTLDREHIAIKYFLMFAFFFMMILIPKAALDSSQHCSFEVANQTVVNNVTSFNYDYICVDNQYSTSSIFYRSIMLLLTIVSIYFFIYAFNKTFRRRNLFG